ncbi:hypothetical protein HK101_000270 [Irineochytrium annulatum]|nr:hypothetical protein HK101_000270 [Irineochytrium annulatum]
MPAPKPKQVAAASSTELIHRAKEIHASLFSNKPTHKRRAIETHYRSDATFNDPLVSVQGTAAIISQFMFLTVLPDITTRIDSILTSASGDLVTIDALITFTVIPYIAVLPIRCLTRFEFDEEGKVCSHDDLWSVRELYANMSLTGWMYELFRTVNGVVSSFVLEAGFNMTDTRRVSGAGRRRMGVAN